MDFVTAERVLSTVVNFAQSQQMGLIIVNHQLELATKFSDQLLYLQDGQLAINQVAKLIDWQQLKQQIRDSEDRSITEWD